MLPETDEGGAFFLAEQLRVPVRDLGLGSDAGEKQMDTRKNRYGEPGDVVMSGSDVVMSEPD
jgi:hypothetical protein